MLSHFCDIPLLHLKSHINKALSPISAQGNKLEQLDSLPVHNFLTAYTELHLHILQGQISRQRSRAYIRVTFARYNRGVTPTQAEETNLNLNQYRDRRTPPARPANAPDDRWVVFHLHINPEMQVFNRLNGRTRVGIQRVSMFHGQRRTGAQIGWRVDNSQYGDLNARGPGFDCIDVPDLTTRNALWYVGTPARGSLPAGSFYDRFSVWANALFNTGYLATPGISPIVRGATFDDNGDIDIGSSPAFLERGDSSSEFFNADPNQVSFTIIRNGNSYTYEFTIPDPGNPP
jgi:chitinase